MAMEEPHNTTPKKKSCGLENDSIFGTIKKFTAPAGNSPKLPTIKDFCILKPISRGAFGKVFLGYKKNNDHDKLFAIKVMRKSDMINKNMISQVITERNALALSRSPFCVTLYYSLQTISSVFLVMEYMVGGDLKSLLAMYGFFEESAARFYTAEICLALQYLHKHGIVHRDIKPDNMLISATGHVKLTDFGLSRIEMRRDLEISDLINCSPNLNARTPGQLLSLTSHLSFGSHEKRQLEQPTDQLHQSSENDSDCSFSNSKQNDSKMSGVSPFFSAEQNGSVIEGLREVRATTPPAEKTADMTSSYYTCNSSVDGGRSSSTGSYESVGNGQVQVVVSDGGSNKENSDSNNKEARGEKAEQHSKNSFDFLLIPSQKSKTHISNDSGVSSRKSDISHIPAELSAIEKAECSHSSNRQDDYSCSDFSRSYSMSNINESNHSRLDYHSPIKNGSRCFKRPEYFRGIKRKRHLVSRVDSLASDPDGSATSTGLTQEIDVMDIGSSTPKKRKATSPIKGVLKVRSLSDDEMPVNENLGTVMFSTPVSSQKIRREGGQLGKLKSTRFALPSSIEQPRKSQAFIKIADESVMSPICTGKAVTNVENTPKTVKTPFRTPKSVRRAPAGSDERILGTPDYLAPELLLQQGHGPAVDWWALGVCLYEFMTGIPPFNDETPQKVFENILSRNIEWPQDDESLSPGAVEAVESILEMDPVKRPQAEQMMQMAFFESIDWTALESAPPPFIPNPDDPQDTGYFEARNVMQHLKLSNFDMESY
ncbi:serine/threonine-protein kinase greatwall [Culex pipiens pallens]|uniref:serine/threonine-protein kinase greatwall n=1 Tax=Culex pipiens pallens TaxID=42434 RepID=UPI0022AA2D94|nr:serine/threonine-protein kinase greatwall [Culex pipiens pallens]